MSRLSALKIVSNNINETIINSGLLMNDRSIEEDPKDFINKSLE